MSRARLSGSPVARLAAAQSALRKIAESGEDVVAG